MRLYLAVAALWSLLPITALAQSSFVNYETPHVHPIDLTPNGSRLLAVNTADARLEVFDVTPLGLTSVGAIPVGVDPVSVRARTNDEVWVVNHISDSVSLVSLSAGSVIATIATDDEPCDVVFAGTPARAFVTCSQVNRVQVFDPTNLGVAPQVIHLIGEDPRAMAVSADGSRVYVAIFESGNDTTILGGGAVSNIAFPPNVVNNNNGPYNGQNPPPNNGNQFSPPIKSGLPAPPRVGMIVRKNGAGQWFDDNNGNWTNLVSGPQAGSSGRPVGWDLYDHDVAIIDTATLVVSYARHLMNMVMAISVNPADGRIAVVGTDAINEVRFEPNLNGVFLRVMAGFVQPVGTSVSGLADLNPHLNYNTSTIPQSERDKSLGDPRGIAWEPAGGRGYVTGMGSNNVVVIDSFGARAGASPTIEVGEGPTGVVYHAATDRLFVLNKFEGSISVVDALGEVETARVAFHDATPPAIKQGRKHLYDTHKNSGLGHVSCGSCHVDARMDRLAWDLGDPSGDMKSEDHQNLGANVPGLNNGFQPWHPMKGPMTTQTLQDIIGHEPLHWRGDRDGLEEFNGAFTGLQGDDVMLTPTEMQEYEDFLATIHFPPNPFRGFNNSLPTSLDTGHASPGRFSAKGTPLPIANAMAALNIYRPPVLLDANAIACSSCHTLPTGMGTDFELNGFAGFTQFPIGPNGEHHLMLVSQDGSTNVTMKVPHLRNMHEKTGFDTSKVLNTAGFGFTHDGSVDTVAQFVAEPVFNVANDQQIADLTAFMLAFAGSELPYGGSILEPPAPASKDAHAGIGKQTTMIDSNNPAPGQIAFIDAMIAQAASGRVGLIVKGRQGGITRGYAFQPGGTFQSDRAAETISSAAIKAAASPGNELTFTVVPMGSQTRLGIDRDLDGFFDRDELDASSNPADPNSVPGCGAFLPYGTGCAGSGGISPSLSMSGCATASGNVTLNIDNGLGGSSALLLFGFNEAATPIGGGCFLAVSPLLPITLGPLPLSAGGPGDGTFSINATLPANTTPATLTMQAFIPDGGAAPGFAATNGLKLVIH